MICNSLYQMAHLAQLTLFPHTHFDLVIADGVDCYRSLTEQLLIDLKLGNVAHILSNLAFKTRFKYDIIFFTSVII